MKFGLQENGDGQIDSVYRLFSPTAGDGGGSTMKERKSAKKEFEKTKIIGSFQHKQGSYF